MRRVRIKDPEHMRRVRTLPCIACQIAGVQQATPSECHHIRRREDGQPYGASQKAHDTETIALCHTCHWNGVGSIYTRREFEAKFGNERDLLAQTLETLYNGTED